MNATASNRLLYADWRKWLTTAAEFPKAHGKRGTATGGGQFRAKI